MRKVRQEVMPFASNLKMLRESKGMTIRELAEELNISKSAVQQYEAATSDPSITVVRKIAEYFDVDINWLAGLKKMNQTRKIR